MLQEAVETCIEIIAFENSLTLAMSVFPYKIVEAHLLLSAPFIVTGAFLNFFHKSREDPGLEVGRADRQEIIVWMPINAINVFEKRYR